MGRQGGTVGWWMAAISLMEPVVGLAPPGGLVLLPRQVAHRMQWQAWAGYSDVMALVDGLAAALAAIAALQSPTCKYKRKKHTHKHNTVSIIHYHTVSYSTAPNVLCAHREKIYKKTYIAIQI